MSTTKEAPKPLEIHGLIDFLERGEFRDRFNSALTEATRATMEEMKECKITFSLGFKFKSREGLMLKPSLELKLPKAEPGQEVMFADRAGNLYTDPPHQLEMELKVTRMDPRNEAVAEKFGVSLAPALDAATDAVQPAS